MSDTQSTTPTPRDPRFEDWRDRLSPTLYIRFRRGPDYEDAFLCIDDGEPDMRAVARMSFTQALALKEAMTVGTFDDLARLRRQRDTARELLKLAMACEPEDKEMWEPDAKAFLDGED